MAQDFVHCRTDDGKASRTLNILDEFSRKCLGIRVERKLNANSVIDVLSDLFILRGVPSFIRSDNGPEFVAQAVRDWIAAVGAKTASIEPGSPWENGSCPTSVSSAEMTAPLNPKPPGPFLFTRSSVRLSH